jgi:hypothetical protein
VHIKNSGIKLPIAPVWGWYCLKVKSVWFFTPSNPTIAFGGFEGETKKKKCTNSYHLILIQKVFL